MRLRCMRAELGGIIRPVRPHPPGHIATLALTLAAMFAFCVPRAHAAATLVSSIPTRYAALIHAPRIIQLRFSEAIVGKSSTVTLTDLTGHELRVSPLKARGDSSLEARIAARLGPGVYMVHWTILSAVDGSKTVGSYQFTVH